MKSLQERASQIAAQLTGRRLQQMEAIVREQLPNAGVEVHPASLQISGRFLLGKWLTNPALRFLTRFFR